MVCEKEEQRKHVSTESGTRSLNARGCSTSSSDYLEISRTALIRVLRPKLSRIRPFVSSHPLLAGVFTAVVFHGSRVDLKLLG